MSEDLDIVVFRTTESIMEARIIAGVLKEEGIPCYVSGQNLQDEFAISQMVMGQASVDIEIPASSREAAEAALERAKEAGKMLDEQAEPGTDDEAP